MDVRTLLDQRVPINRIPDQLLSAGIHMFTIQDAVRVADVSETSARPALARLEENNKVFSPSRGLYVAIPPEYRAWGTTPATWFIDALMAYLSRAYYVAFLSAAELHEAAHQRPQVFQVAVDRDLRNRSFGRVRLRFITNRAAGELPIVRINVPTGTIAVATPELTALDLTNRPSQGGGLGNVATIIIELADDKKLRIDRIAALVERFPLAAARRLGWLLENLAELDAGPLAEIIRKSSREPSQLDPHGPRRGHVDARWHVRVNTQVEADL